jgi:hypothetical protein
VFTFGDAEFEGSTAASGSTVPIVGMIPTAAGYAVIDQEGTVTSFPAGTSTTTDHGDHDEGTDEEPDAGEGPIIALDDPRVTDEQRAAAQDLIDRTTAGMARFPDEQSLIDAGYGSIGDARTGYEHYVNLTLLFDTTELDENMIESVVLRIEPDGSKTVVSAMYLLNVGKDMGDVPDIAGELTTWHTHTDLCFGSGEVMQIPETGCPGGTIHFVPPPMLHVWMVPFACGPFGGIETSGHGNGCDPDDHHD